MEIYLYKVLGFDKTFINPINNNEVLSCSELHDNFKRCKKDFQKGKESSSKCSELKNITKKCFYSDEKDFQLFMVKTFEEKKRYLLHLKKYDSILYNIYVNDPSTFSVINYKEFYSEEDEISRNLNEEYLFKK